MRNYGALYAALVRKDADPNLPLQTRAQSAVTGITYATMRVSVQPLDASAPAKATPSADSPSPSVVKKGSGKSGTRGSAKKP
jgi:hypothetical protein